MIRDPVSVIPAKAGICITIELSSLANVARPGIHHKTTMTIKEYYDSLITPEKLNDPQAWLQKAIGFHATTKLLFQEFEIKMVDGAHVDEIGLIMNSMGIVAYLACQASELYMKGYLIALGLTPEEIIDMRHDIERIRIKCYELSKREEFNSSSLREITNSVGRHVFNGGGDRYPDRRGMPISNSCVDALEQLNLLLNEVIVP